MKSVLAEGVQNGVEKFCSHATVVGIVGRAAILKLLDIEQFEGKLQCNFAIGHGITFFRMRIVFAEQGYNPIVTYSLTVVNRNITERDETMKYEVWVLTEKGHIAYQWTQFFCDSREVALQKVEEWLGKAEKIEVKPV